MTFGIVRIAALECWKGITDPCSGGLFYGGINSGIEAPLIWQSGSYPISCQWQNKAGSQGFGHISIFCSLWDWASNLTDILLDYRFDDYPVGESEQEADHAPDPETQVFFDRTPEILSRHYFRTLMLAAETLEDLTILLEVMSGPGLAKKKLRSELSVEPLSVDALIGYVNRICKHKGDLHECNHHIPKHFLDGVENFNQSHYVNWSFLRDDFIEIPRYVDIIQVVIGAFRKIDELLNDPDQMTRVGIAFGKPENSTPAAPSLGTE